MASSQGVEEQQIEMPAQPEDVTLRVCDLILKGDTLEWNEPYAADPLCDTICTTIPILPTEVKARLLLFEDFEKREDVKAKYLSSGLNISSEFCKRHADATDIDMCIIFEPHNDEFFVKWSRRLTVTNVNDYMFKVEPRRYMESPVSTTRSEHEPQLFVGEPYQFRGVFRPFHDLSIDLFAKSNLLSEFAGKDVVSFTNTTVDGKALGRFHGLLRLRDALTLDRHIIVRSIANSSMASYPQ
jgi:hypothetical protein